LSEFIFAELDNGELEDLNDKLHALQNKLEKACMKVAMDI
jgi:hypothetical protein